MRQIFDLIQSLVKKKFTGKIVLNFHKGAIKVTREEQVKFT